VERQKRVAAIHDISGVGAVPSPSRCPSFRRPGSRPASFPPPVLSAHTGFSGFTYRDLTEDIRPAARHWKSLGLSFDALYSGFLGSFRQVEIVSELFGEFRTKGNLIVVDPVMADHGELYKSFTPDFAGEMAKLCRGADIITPNITEAAFLLKKPYRPGPYERATSRSLPPPWPDWGQDRSS
jgi:pyridoxine kinase